MSIEIKAPTFPESITDGTVASWHKLPGEAVARDELIVDIETDKVVLEIVAPADGVLSDILKQEGETVLSNEVIALFTASDLPSVPQINNSLAEALAEPADITASPDHSGPAVRRLLEEKELDAAAITGTGKGARITKPDVEQHLKASAPATTPTATVVPITKPVAMPVVLDTAEGPRITKRVPMTRLRSTIAKRLVEAQQNAAMLTTYNEVNMKPIMDLRKQYKPLFEKTHNGARLGFMSFFVKAATEALKRFPSVNASIDGSDMVYHGYQDIGVAVSTQRGLVVPVLRDTDSMSLAAIETGIADLAQRGSNGKLAIEDMQGGTFTITNGGVFGSLMSTPILNPPQTAILGMHKIQERPMAMDGEVVILPMMYLALSYDHRMIDGREAVQFLVTIKDLLEDPARILLQV